MILGEFQHRQVIGAVQVIYQGRSDIEEGADQIIREVSRTKKKTLIECEEIWVKA